MSQKGSVQCISNFILRSHVTNQILLTKAIYLLKINNNLGLLTFTNFWRFKPSGTFFTILNIFPSCVQKSSIPSLVPPSVLIINKKRILIILSKTQIFYNIFSDNLSTMCILWQKQYAKPYLISRRRYAHFIFINDPYWILIRKAPANVALVHLEDVEDVRTVVINIHEEQKFNTLM